MKISKRIEHGAALASEGLDDIGPIHPGEILLEEYMQPLGLTAYKLAKDLGIPAPRIYDIIRQKRGITADTAIRLGLYFNSSADLWLGLQNSYDTEVIIREKGAEIMAQVVPCAAIPDEG